jgi:hypothetical protein
MLVRAQNLSDRRIVDRISGTPVPRHDGANCGAVGRRRNQRNEMTHADSLIAALERPQ